MKIHSYLSQSERKLASSNYNQTFNEILMLSLQSALITESKFGIKTYHSNILRIKQA